MKVFSNEDWVNFWLTRTKNKKVDYEYLKQFMLNYKGTGITDFCFNINGTVSSTPSDIFETWGDKYLAKEENGVAVDYTNSFTKLWYDVFVNQGIDAYALWIETLKEIGINPWLSIRMNDCHHNEKTTHLVKSSFVDAHPDLHIARHRQNDLFNGNVYFDKLFDFSIKEVRDRIFGYIEEQLNRYDVAGIELDFTREAFCFPYGKQDGEIITQLIAKIRNLLDQVGQKRNKKIQLSILCQADPYIALKNGFDIHEIANRGLVDTVIASPRWLTTNTDIPIELWKKLLPSDVEFGCMQQYLVSPYEKAKAFINNFEISYGLSVANIDRGADVVYLYNYMDSDLEEKDFPLEQSNIGIDRKRLFEYFNDLKDIEKCREKQRRIPVAFDDFVNLYEKKISLLPYKTNWVSTFTVQTGNIGKDKQVYLILQTEEQINPNEISVYANTVKATFVENGQENKNLIQGNVYTFKLDVPLAKNVGVEIVTENNFTITYIEVLIK